MSANIRMTLVLSLLLGGLGCGIVGPVGCTADVRFGVVVTVVDALDGAFVTEGLFGVLVDGSFREEMEVFENTLRGAAEREGQYDLTIVADGYSSLTQRGIEVNADFCHVVPVGITAELEKSALSV